MQKQLKYYTLVMVLLALHTASTGQISLTTMGSPYSQNFNTMAMSGTSTVLPAGWHFSEIGTGANTTYTANNGSSTTGDTYSLGQTSNADRALGGLRSGALNPRYGANFQNNTGATIVNLSIIYTGETWRIGAANRSDRIEFEYSLNATSLTTGNWIAESALNYENPGNGTTGGGSLRHSLTVSHTITGLSIPSGATFWIRWIDFNAAGADDAMGVDQFSITPSAVPLSITTGAVTGFPINTTCTTGGSGTVGFTSTGTFNAGNNYFVQISNANGTFSPAQIIGSLASTANSGTINYTIPPGFAGSTNYRIRVTSSNPGISGTNNGVNLTVNRSCCPEVKAILVNACSLSEGTDEYIVFETKGMSVDIDELFIETPNDGDWCNFGCTGGEIINNAAYINQLNTLAGCALFEFSSVIPPNSHVYVFTGTTPSFVHDFSTQCGNAPLYAVFMQNTNTTGRFANAANANRTVSIMFNTFSNGNCADDATYYSSTPTTGNPGDFAHFNDNGAVSYSNQNICIYPLSADLLHFGATHQNNATFVTWTSANEINLMHYAVERADNLDNFREVALVSATNQTGVQQYKVTDLKPLNGKTWYRLRMVGVDGETEYSNLVLVTPSTNSGILQSYISYNKDASTLHYSGELPIEIIIYSLDGKTVHRQTTSATLELPNLSGGLYLVELSDGLQHRVIKFVAE